MVTYEELKNGVESIDFIRDVKEYEDILENDSKTLYPRGIRCRLIEDRGREFLNKLVDGLGQVSIFNEMPRYYWVQYELSTGGHVNLSLTKPHVKYI